MMRHCRLPLVVSFECRLAAHLHLDTVRVRRAPLALLLLWANYAAQADGMETWWLEEREARKDAAAVHSELASLRGQADDLVNGWAE